jgi:Ca-activated chloride channel family protein
MFLRTAFCLCLLPIQVVACDTALVLAVDVSGSVDQREYRIQMDGLAEALADGVIAEALVGSRAQVALVQWTGSGRQEVTLPWREMTGFSAIETLRQEITIAPRAWRHFSTAIGEALMTSAALFEQVPLCSRRIIDVSGDGVSNEGLLPKQTHAALSRMGVTVIALAIEGADDDLTGYFYENVILGEGAFVTTADGYLQYPDKIRQKLLRELIFQSADSTFAR